MAVTNSVVGVELLSVINHGLPNIAHYLKECLKKENLSEEAELKRQKYESILLSLEHGGVSAGRPPSFICDEDNGYFSANRNRVSDVSEPLAPPHQSHSGYILWRDDKLRWHRCWCKAESRDMRFYIYEDTNEEILLRSFTLENVTVRYMHKGQTADSEKDNCLILSGILYDALGESSGNKMEASITPIDVCFAAYTDSEYKKWKDVLKLLQVNVVSSRDSTRISLLLDGNPWSSAVAHDSASSSSSNFSSNRDSIVSNTSSLHNTHRMSSRSDLGEGKEFGEDTKSLALSKQLQPLPSPPHQIQSQVLLDEECTPSIQSTPASNTCEEDDNISVGTIYESIDNLVLQFDDAFRQIVKSGGTESTKRPERSLFQQLSSRGKGNKSKLFERKADLERGERYSGFMLKKSNSGSWKKKWCVLKGCIFGYYKSQTDSHGHDYVLLNGEVSRVQDAKKNFVFSLHCKGVPEMYFAVNDEESYFEWLTKIGAACNSAADYADALQKTDADVEKDGSAYKFSDSIYNVPRALSVGSNQLYDVPRGNFDSFAMTPDAAIDAGIYNVPRSLMLQPMDDEYMERKGSQNVFEGNPLDIYNYPRSSMSPDEEGIYDDPLDIIDMEIYDYPPDAMESFDLEFSGLDPGNRLTEMGDSRSSSMLSDNWNSPIVPPLPNSARPSMTLSVGSYSDENQSSRNSAASGDMVYDHPRMQTLPNNVVSDSNLSAKSEGNRDNFIDSQSTDLVDSSSLEYGQCIMRGYLFKKERFMTWIKVFCIIRNNFLECHKPQADSYGLILKLFLPGSEVKEGGGDAKKKCAFQVRHPRREGVLTFAADSDEESHHWIDAFQSGALIEVQPVSTVEEIRITDLEMQKRWTTLDKDDPTQKENPSETSNQHRLPRCNTYTAGTVSDDFSSDTLKRRRKFSWVKSNFMRRKSDKKISGSQTDLNSNRLSNMSFNPNQEPSYTSDPLRKSVSLELLPTSTESDESPHHIKSKMITSYEGRDQFLGYLRVQRKGADNVWVRYWCILEDFKISCYISQRDLTLTLSIQLPGSRVAEAEIECHRKHSFKVLHVESGQCLYFAAEDHEEFFRWFSEVTKFGEQIVSDDSTTVVGPFTTYYAIPKDCHVIHHNRLSVVSEGGSSNVSESSVVNTEQPSTSTFYRGELRKASHTGKWKKRYCVVQDGHLNIYHNSEEKSSITSISLSGCSLELVGAAQTSQYKYLFKLNPIESGKSHTFAAPSETELYAWVSALRDTICERSQSSTEEKNSVPQSPNMGKSSLKRKSKKLKDADLISYIPASSISSPEYSGFADVQYGTESWTKYWCIASGNCLYIYQNQSAASTIKTIVLPGYDVKIGELHSTKYEYNLSINHERVSPVWISVDNQDQLNKWAEILDKYTRPEGASKQRKISNKLLPDEVAQVTQKVISKSVPASKKKGPVRADHSISAVRTANEESPLESSGSGLQSTQDAIIHRYEKRIRKTHKVANQTEQKLKKQQASLLHFKKELSRHVVRLQELSDSGNPHALKRLKNIRTKIVQIDKIVPYLGKYVLVNRKAEMQTVAVLKESCTMELQKFSQSSPVKVVARKKPASSTISLMNSDKVDGDIPATSQNQQENPYASLSEVRNEAASCSVKLRNNYAELDFNNSRSGENIRPPSVKYSEVRIKTEEKSSMPTSIQPCKGEAKSRSNYVELDFQKIGAEGNLKLVSDDKADASTQPDQFSPEESPPAKKAFLSNSHGPDESLHDITLTPENAALLIASISSPSSSSTSTENTTSIPQVNSVSVDSSLLESSSGVQDCSLEKSSSPIAPLRLDSIPTSHSKRKSPPPVAKKPSSRHSPIHQLPGKTSINDQVSPHLKATQLSPSLLSGNESISKLEGTPIKNIIKALQQQ